MFKFDTGLNYFLYTKYADFRCGINSLCLKIKADNPKEDLLAKNVYIFICKRKDKIKILARGGDGFWLLTHQLEKSKFKWIKSQNSLVSISEKQLGWLLDGLEINPKNAHKEITKLRII